jgi:di/tricarboxylate transporter
LILFLILILITDRWHGLDAGWVIILLSFVAFLPVVGLMNEGVFQKMSLTAVFFVVGCMSIGSAATASGADKMLIGAIAPMFEGQSGLAAMLLGYLAGTAINFLLTPLAAFSAMTVPITQLALEVGVNPLPVMSAFSYGLEQYIFPYEYAVLLFFYATGWVHLRHIMLVFFMRFFVALILLVAVAYPYWSMLGVFEPLAR